MPDLLNLVVDLAALPPEVSGPPDVEIGRPATADDRTLAWIDSTFGGWWSSEASAGRNVVAWRAGDPGGFATIEASDMRFTWLEGIARERDVGIFGPMGVAPPERGTGLGHALLIAALRALRERGYARAIIPAVSGDRLVRYYADAVGAAVAERYDQKALLGRSARTVVMASGHGGNFQSVLDAIAGDGLPLDIVALVTNGENAYAIERARKAGVPVNVVTWNRTEESRADYDARLLDVVTASAPNLILLLGWMHLLSEWFVRRFPEMLNVHPAFLPLDPKRDDVVFPDGTSTPAFRGARAVRDALAACSQWVGATLHRVTTATDRGPVMTRKPVRVLTGEDEARLMKRLRGVEHETVIAGITRWLYERQ